MSRDLAEEAGTAEYSESEGKMCAPLPLDLVPASSASSARYAYWSGQEVFPRQRVWYHHS